MDPSPTYSTTMQQCGLPYHGQYLRLHPLLHNKAYQDKKYGPSERTEKIQLSNEEIANLSDAEFKTLVIRMHTEMVDYGCKMEEKVEAIQSKMKRNVQGTNTEGKETRTQINDLEQNKELNIQPEQNEETRIQKHEKRLKNLQDSIKHSNIQIIQVPEEKRKSKQLKTYLKI